MHSKSVVRLCRNGPNSAAHFDLPLDSRSVYNEKRYVKKRRATPCRLPSQPRASGESQTAQVTHWRVVLQHRVLSAQEASGNQSGTRRCRYTAERHTPVERGKENVAGCDILNARGGVLLGRFLWNRMVLDECRVQPMQTSLHPSSDLVCLWLLDDALVARQARAGVNLG